MQKYLLNNQLMIDYLGKITKTIEISTSNHKKYLIYMNIILLISKMFQYFHTLIVKNGLPN